MERTDEFWGAVLRSAQAFLRRYGDVFTRAECDDLAQEAASVAWRWNGARGDDASVCAAVRTIARRLRSRAIRQRLRLRHEGDVARLPSGRDRADGVRLHVDGRAVPRDWLLERLPSVLDGLPWIDRRLLLGFYEGFCCAELAARFHRTEETVKVRIHRARRRVQTEIESEVRAAGALDGL